MGMYRGWRSCGRWTVGLVGVAFSLAAVGCGSRGPAVQMVEGVVTLDGEPLAGATVSFSPAGSKGALPAAGLTGADGTFRLNAVHGAASGGGTTVGEYVVTVTKDEVTDAGGSGPLDGDDLPPYKPPVVKHLVPEAYSSASKSPLRATVVAGKNSGDGFRFELTSKAK
jgi:hypothetical protein